MRTDGSKEHLRHQATKITTDQSTTDTITREPTPKATITRSGTSGQKQAGRVWNRYLVKKLLSIGFERSKVDDCVFYRSSILFVLYVDDSIIAGSSQKEIDESITDMKGVDLDLTVKGGLADFLVPILTTKEMVLYISPNHTLLIQYERI